MAPPDDRRDKNCETTQLLLEDAGSYGSTHCAAVSSVSINAYAVQSLSPTQRFPVAISPDDSLRWFDSRYAMLFWAPVKLLRIAGMINPYVSEKPILPTSNLAEPTPEEYIWAGNKLRELSFASEEEFLHYFSGHEQEVINNLNSILSKGIGKKPENISKLKRYGFSVRGKVILGISLLSASSMLPTIVYVNDFIQQFWKSNTAGITLGIVTTVSGSFFVIFGNKTFLNKRFEDKIKIKDGKVKCKIVGAEGLLKTLPLGLLSSVGLASFFYEAFGSGKHLTWSPYAWIPLTVLATIFPTMGNAAILSNYGADSKNNLLHWGSDLLRSMGVVRYNSTPAVTAGLIAACQDRFDFMIKSVRKGTLTKDQLTELLPQLKTTDCPLMHLAKIPGACEVQKRPGMSWKFFTETGHIAITTTAMAGMWYYLDVVLEMSATFIGVTGAPPYIVGVGVWLLNGFIQDYLMYKLIDVVAHEVSFNLDAVVSTLIGIIPTVLFAGCNLMQNLDSAGDETLSFSNVQWYQYISVAFTAASILYSYNRLFHGNRVLNTKLRNQINELVGMLEKMKTVISRLDHEHAYTLYHILYAMSPVGDNVHDVPGFASDNVELSVRAHR